MLLKSYWLVKHRFQCHIDLLLIKESRVLSSYRSFIRLRQSTNHFKLSQYKDVGLVDLVFLHAKTLYWLKKNSLEHMLWLEEEISLKKN